MKKIIILTALIFLSCKEKVIWEIYQGGKMIDKVCSNRGGNSDSYSYGGSYYKMTDEKCEEAK